MGLILCFYSYIFFLYIKDVKLLLSECLWSIHWSSCLKFNADKLQIKISAMVFLSWLVGSSRQDLIGYGIVWIYAVFDRNLWWVYNQNDMIDSPNNQF